jgi:ferredoxin--NADP+ reductase
MRIDWVKISEIITETPDTKTYVLDRPDDFTWEEGAHTHLALKGFNVGEKPNRDLIRHMSISTLPYENKIGITTRVREQCSIFKTELKKLKIGDSVALFKTHTNVPLRRQNKSIYLLSNGVGIATFRPLVLEFLRNNEGVKSVHSLNVDASNDHLFTDLFEANENLSAQYVSNREEYYKEVKDLASDKEGLFYIVGSDDFIFDTIACLRKADIADEQLYLDKYESRRLEFLGDSERLI